MLLEVGFDTTTPYEQKDISSWALDKIIEKELTDGIIDNRALGVKCYRPEYTFVEKLQTISTKFRKQQLEGEKPSNFIRNYYDIYQLLHHQPVLNFIGTYPYYEHKEKRFRKTDEKNIALNEAFILSNPLIRREYMQEFERKSDLYYGTPPSFEDILTRLHQYIEKL